MMGMRRVLVVALLIGAVAMISTVSRAASMSPQEGLSQQIKVAVEHAKLAQGATSMKDAKAQLQTVLNCIERGKEGSCSDVSGGMMAHSKAMGAMASEAVAWTELSWDVAKVGMKATSMDKVKAAAWATQVVLEHEGGMVR